MIPIQTLADYPKKSSTYRSSINNAVRALKHSDRSRVFACPPPVLGPARRFATAVPARIPGLALRTRSDLSFPFLDEGLVSPSRLC